MKFQFQAVLAVGAGRSLRHSLETLVVHPAPEQTATPGQPPLPHPRVGLLPPTYTGGGGGAANMNYCTTLAFTFLCCSLGVGQFVRFVGGFALFCCFFLPVSSRRKLAVIRNSSRSDWKMFYLTVTAPFSVWKPLFQSYRQGWTY